MANSDFFGGILDNLRGATDYPGFMDAMARGITYGVKPQNDVKKLSEANYLSRLDNMPDNVHYSPTREPDKSNEVHSVNFEQTEQSWLLRLRRFSQIDSELQSGRVNEGKPQ